MLDMLRSRKDGGMNERFGWGIIDFDALGVSNKGKQRYSSGHKILLGTEEEGRRRLPARGPRYNRLIS
jgi:hypothetical protein